jgi:hypothetical protein
MGFVVKKDKSYTWPCTISEPVDGGTFNDQKVKVKFKMLSQTRIDEIVKNEAEEDADILSEVIIGWDAEAFRDETGEVLEYNDDNRDLILSVPFVRSALIKGFFESVSGKAFKRKN